MKPKIILTGGSGGIGRSIASQLAEKGYSIVNLDTKKPEECLTEEIFVQTDLVDENEITKVISMPLITDNLYGVIHCAGYGGPYQKITDISSDDLKRIIGTNLTGIILILQKVLPLIAASKQGRIVFISSTLGHVGSAYSSVYSAAKHGLNGLMRSLTDEWGKEGITFNSVSPGFVNTAMGIREDQVNDHLQKIISKTPVGRIALPEEIARVVLFLLDEKSSYISGADWAIDGGMTAI